MKRLSALIIISLILTFLSAILTSAAPGAANSKTKDELGKILNIKYQSEAFGTESLIFELDTARKFKVFRLGGERPRLVVDFLRTVYDGPKEQTLKNRRFATTVRTGVHRIPKVKTRVVLDLEQFESVEHRQEFVEAENKLVVTLSEVKGAKQDAAKKNKNEPVEKKVKGAKAAATGKAENTKDKPKTDSGRIATNNKLIQVVPQVRKISFDDTSNRGEMVLFHLNDFYPPKVSAIEQDHPRVLCEFLNAKLDPKVNVDIKSDGKYVTRITTIQHDAPRKVQVILELALEKDYDLQQVFFKNDNLFVLIVNELPADKDKEN